MAAGLTRYELRVGTLLSRAALAAFHVPVTPTAIPRNTVYRFRIPADRDPSEVLHRLTEFDVQVLEIRRCSVLSRRDRGQGEARRTAPPVETTTPTETWEITEPPGAAAGVVIPFPVRAAHVDPAAGSRSPGAPGLDPDGDDPAG
jgi:hypothetical protein